MVDERTYVRVPKEVLQDRKNQWSAFKESDVEELLLQYAKKQSTNDGLVKGGKICRHKAIKHLKEKVRGIVNKLGVELGWEDMTLHVSIRQIEKLLSSLKSNDKLCLTGFSLIILNVLISENDDYKQLVEKMEQNIVNTCQIYIRKYNDNIIPEYIVSCDLPFENAMSKKQVGSYPHIPRTFVRVNNNLALNNMTKRSNLC